jgi:hypothetical protein
MFLSRKMNTSRPKLNIDPEAVRKAEREVSKIKENKLSIQLKGIIAPSGRKEVTHNELLETLEEMMNALEQEFRKLISERLAPLCHCSYL